VSKNLNIKVQNVIIIIILLLFCSLSYGCEPLSLTLSEKCTLAFENEILGRISGTKSRAVDRRWEKTG
jgi:hypothetical protein